MPPIARQLSRDALSVALLVIALGLFALFVTSIYQLGYRAGRLDAPVPETPSAPPASAPTRTARR